MMLLLEGSKVPVATWPLARWEDSSISWLGVEFISPPLSAKASLSGLLTSSDIESPLEPLVSSLGKQGLLQVKNTALLLSVANEEQSLFSLHGHSLKGNLALGFQTQTWSGPVPQVWQRGEATIERNTGGSATIRREDSFVDHLGRPVLRFINRATIFRDSPLLHLQATIEVIRGTHFAPTWEITLPQKVGPAGEWSQKQIHENLAELNGKQVAKKLSGSHVSDSFSVAVDDFWQTFPNALRQSGKQFHIQLLNANEDDHIVLEPGFARTKSIWISTDSKQLPSEQQAEALANFPLRPVSTPEWYCASGGFGPLSPAKSNSNMIRLLSESIRAVQARAVKRGHHFGFQNWGDFLGRDHTLSYYGHLNQEYDPGLSMSLAFARTGNLDFLEHALPLARHYSDVDTSFNGGIFQHRSTRRHLENWIADIMAASIRKSLEKTGSFDGTAKSVIKLIKKQGKSLGKDTQRILESAKKNGATEDELVEIAIQSTALRLLLNIANKGAKNSDLEDAGPYDYAKAVAESSGGRQYGFSNPDKSFEPFFKLYGGTWRDFPSFHVDNSYDPAIRHTGGHSLVESVIYASWLTADLRMQETSLRVAKHHVDVLLPQEIEKLTAALRKKPNPPTRTVAWPLLNMCLLEDMVRNMPNHSGLREQLYSSCGLAADMLISVPLDRIESSIHAGVTLEALSEWHRKSGDKKVADYIVRLAQYWGENHYVKQTKSFRYKSRAGTSSGTGFTGLMIYGLAYAQHLKNDAALEKTIREAWANLPKIQSRSKSFSMIYRSASRAAYYLEN
jgi:hypothetical protein